MPLSCIDWLPAVYCSSGVRAVSAVMSSMRRGSTMSCSAATCVRAVLMPCPSSALPVNTLMRPSASMRIHASSIGSVLRLPGSFAA